MNTTIIFMNTKYYECLGTVPPLDKKRQTPLNQFSVVWHFLILALFFALLRPVRPLMPLYGHNRDSTGAAQGHNS
jgi:hypothetical protein